MMGLHAIDQKGTKLLRLVLTIHTTTTSSERSMRTLKRMNTYLRNSMNNDCLSCLNCLAIENELIKSRLLVEGGRCFYCEEGKTTGVGLQGEIIFKLFFLFTSFLF